MNTADIAEDALLAVSAMQRTILDRGIAMCYYALDNTGDTTVPNASDYGYSIEGQMPGRDKWEDRYHAWVTDLHTGEMQECDLSDESVIDMVELDPVDVDAAIEEAGWCGALGATYGFPFVICPIGTITCPADGVAFMRGQLGERG